MTAEHTPDQKDLLQKMDDAVALSPCDPQRLQVAEAIAEAGPWAEEAWLKLLREDEELRLDLLRVGVPEGLQGRLMQLPQPFPVRRQAWRWIGGVAAGLAAMMAVAFGWMEFQARQNLNHRLDVLAAAAITHHQHHLSMAPQVSRNRSPAEAAEALNAQKRLSFPVQLPPLSDRGFHFVGAAICQLGGHAVPCTIWEKDGHQFTMYQFSPQEYGLPETFAARGVGMEQAKTGLNRDRSMFWAESGRAYSLVADEQALELAGRF